MGKTKRRVELRAAAWAVFIHSVVVTLSMALKYGLRQSPSYSGWQFDRVLRGIDCPLIGLIHRLVQIFPPLAPGLVGDSLNLSLGLTEGVASVLVGGLFYSFIAGFLAYWVSRRRRSSTGSAGYVERV